MATGDPAESSATSVLEKFPGQAGRCGETVPGSSLTCWYLIEPGCGFNLRHKGPT